MRTSWSDGQDDGALASPQTGALSSAPTSLFRGARTMFHLDLLGWALLIAGVWQASGLISELVQRVGAWLDDDPAVPRGPVSR